MEQSNVFECPGLRFRVFGATSCDEPNQGSQPTSTGTSDSPGTVTAPANIRAVYMELDENGVTRSKKYGSRRVTKLAAVDCLLARLTLSAAIKVRIRGHFGGDSDQPDGSQPTAEPGKRLPVHHVFLKAGLGMGGSMSVSIMRGTSGWSSGKYRCFSTERERNRSGARKWANWATAEAQAFENISV